MPCKQPTKSIARRVAAALLCLCLSAGPCSPQALAQPGGHLQKESKKQAKAMKTEGWQVFGSGKSVREALDDHYAALQQGSGRLTPIEGHAKARELNVAVKKSQNHAAQQYAAMMETSVEGSTQTETTSATGDAAGSTTKLSSNFLSSTQQKVKALKPTAVFYRNLANGWVEVKALYLIDTSL